MHLLINKFLDRKIPCGVRASVNGGIDEDVYGDLAGIAKQAEIFDFGKIHLEPIKDDEHQYVYEIPLTPDEEEWYDLGLIPFPAPFCVFEYTFTRRAALIVDARDHPKVLRVTSFNDAQASGIWVRYPPEGKFDPLEQPGRRFGSLSSKSRVDSLKGALLDSIIKSQVTSNIDLAKYMALMINSRTTEIRPSDPVPAKLAAARRRNMKSEIRPHHIVTIVPKQYLRQEPGSPGNGLHAPRCLHWRRSHLRRYEHATPRAVWLNAPGYREPGYYVVIPRQLVGKRDMAEVVSHTYRVHHSL